ncbi:hypothetical protein GEMRC1_012415 [Eukaryota sp. GEM-RC1]
MLYSASLGLPSHLQDRLTEDLPNTFKECCDGLSWCLATSAFRDTLVFWMQRLDLLIYIKCPIPDEIAPRILNVVWDLIQHPEQDHKSLSALCRLFSDLLGTVPADTDFVVDWKACYDLAERYAFSRFSRYHAALPRSVSNSIMSLFPAITRFFTEDSPSQILDFLTPLFCPFDTKHHQAHGFLCVLLPTRIRKFIEPEITYVPLILKSWEFSDQTALEPHILTMSLLYRLAKSRPTFDWEPYFGTIMMKVLHLLHLPLSDKGSRSPKLESSYSSFLSVSTKAAMFFEAAGSWLAYALRPPSISSLHLSHFKHFIKVIKPFLHPQTEGHWSRSIGDLLSTFTSQLNKRVGREKIAIDLYPGLITAVYARSSSLSHDALLSLSDLAELQPNVVIPKLLTTIQESLLALQEPHLVPASLMLMSFTVQPLLRYLDQLNKEGRKEDEATTWKIFGQICNDCLVAIDPVDSKKCLNALKMYLSIFARIPVANHNSITNNTPWFDFVNGLRSLIPDIVSRLCVLVRVGEIPSDSTFEGLVDVIFQGLDDDLYKRCFDTVFDFLKNNIVYEDPFGALSALVSAVCFKNPDYSIPKILNFIQSRIFDRTTDLLLPSQIALSSQRKPLFYEHSSTRPVFLGAEDSSHYYIAVLNGLVTRSGGKMLLKEMPRIVAIVSGFLKSSNPAIQQESVSCIRFALYSLLCSYPQECRPTVNNQHPAEIGGYVRSRCFSETCVDFYSPSEETISEVLKLCESLLNWCCEGISLFNSSVDVSISERRMLLGISLNMVGAMVNGLSPVSRLIDSEAQSDYMWKLPYRLNSSFSVWGNPTHKLDLSNLIEKFPIFTDSFQQLSSPKTLRDQISPIVITAINLISSISPDDSTSLSLCSSILDALVSKNFCSSKWFAFRLEYHFQLRGLFVDETVSFDLKYTSRALQVERVFLHYHALVTTEIGFSCPAQPPNGCLEGLLHLSVHPYLSVRETAQDPIGYVTKNVEGVAKLSVDYLEECLKSDDLEFHEVKGLIYLFGSRRLIATRFVRVIFTVISDWVIAGNFPSNISSSEVTRLVPHLLDVCGSYSDIFSFFEPIFSINHEKSLVVLNKYLLNKPDNLTELHSQSINDKSAQNYQDASHYLNIFSLMSGPLSLSTIDELPTFIASPLLEFFLRLIRPSCFFFKC